jgi:hypothetical protein
VLFCVLCRIVVPLPPGTNPFAVRINNNNKTYAVEQVNDPVGVNSHESEEIIGNSRTVRMLYWPSKLKQN